jgi:hypothetical protein
MMDDELKMIWKEAYKSMFQPGFKLYLGGKYMSKALLPDQRVWW